LVSMEPAFSVDNFSAIAAAHDYILLLGQPLSELSGASWYIPSHPAPPVPFVLGQCILLINPQLPLFFGCFKSIVRLERSYLVISVSPEASAYGPYIPLPCQVYLPTSFIMLPRMHRIQYSYLAPFLPDDIHKCYSAYIPS